MTIAVHQTARLPTTQPTAQWLACLLTRVAQAAGFASPPPVEIRPTGRWSGWCHDPASAPDGRVCLWSRIVFWSKEAIIEMYIHEATPRLLSNHRILSNGSHGPEFFALNASLLLRCVSFFEADPIQRLSLYDLQDRCSSLEKVEEWQTYFIEWALRLARQIAATEMTAEQLAAVVVEGWKTQVKAAFEGEQKSLKNDYQRRLREVKTVQRAERAELIAWLITPAALLSFFFGWLAGWAG